MVVKTHRYVVRRWKNLKDFLSDKIRYSDNDFAIARTNLSPKISSSSYENTYRNDEFADGIYTDEKLISLQESTFQQKTDEE